MMNIQGSIETISRRSLHDELVERVQDLIVSGKLAPGSKLPEKELCVQFGVSRTPMREALKVLAADGLVVLETNRGAWVSKVTLKELDELFPVMGALEALAGELACRNITDEKIEEVRSVHIEMLKHHKRGNLYEYFRTNQLIHEQILDAAANSTLSTQYKSLSTRVRRARYMANISEERWAKAVSEHEEILTALENRQGEKLAKILKTHLHNKYESVRNWFLVQ